MKKDQNPSSSSPGSVPDPDPHPDPNVLGLTDPHPDPLATSAGQDPSIITLK
jgi:hypothetical protein